MKKLRLVGMVGVWTFILLGVVSAAMNDRRDRDFKGRGEIVIVGNPVAELDSFIVYDAGNDVEGAVQALRLGEVDFVRFQLPGVRPESACDDAVDCAQTIKDTCELIDPWGAAAGIIVVYNGSSGTCTGTCDDGQSVTVICVRS